MWWFIAFKAGVPNLRGLMPDDLRWSWCNNNRNRVHSQCNVVWIALKLTSLLQSMKNCLPWNHFLVPKRLGGDCCFKASVMDTVSPLCPGQDRSALHTGWVLAHGHTGLQATPLQLLWSHGFRCPEGPHREVGVRAEVGYLVQEEWGMLTQE